MATQKGKEALVITAQKRDTLGKQVKKLRKAGFVPANIYGKDFESTAITLSLSDFQKVYNAAGETGIVNITIEGEKSEIPTLIRLVQTHPLTESILHAEFRKVNLKQKIEAEVPLEFTGESPAVKQGAVVLYQMDVITVEALPANIPSEIVIDISALTEVGQTITVADLPKSEDYEVMNDPEATIVSTTAHKEEELEPDTSTTIPEGEEAEGAEGAEATDGESAESAPAEDSGKSEEK